MESKDKPIKTRKRILPRRYYTIGEYDLRRRPFIEYLRMWGRGKINKSSGQSCSTQFSFVTF